MTKPIEPAFPIYHPPEHLANVDSGFTAYEWVVLEFAKALATDGIMNGWRATIDSARKGADEFFRQMEAKEK